MAARSRGNAVWEQVPGTKWGWDQVPGIPTGSDKMPTPGDGDGGGGGKRCICLLLLMKLHVQFPQNTMKSKEYYHVCWERLDTLRQ